MGFVKAISLFIKIPSHFKWSLSGNHGNQVIFPYTPVEVFSERCYTAMSKKDDLECFFFLFVLHQYVSPLSHPYR